ncbi:MAG: NfeD family protein [Firmicutes bacterium]|nr:NfeD family protein [Bacillota bacterium]
MPFWVMPAVWAVAIAVFLVVEYFTHELVTIWFAAGFVVGLILSFIPVLSDWWHLQLGASVVASGVLLVLTRPVVKKWIQITPTHLNVDKRIGQTTRLISAITADEDGTVKFDDVLWVVTSKIPIESEKLVKIISVEGSRFTVEEVITEEPIIIEE